MEVSVCCLLLASLSEEGLDPLVHESTLLGSIGLIREIFPHLDQAVVLLETEAFFFKIFERVVNCTLSSLIRFEAA